MHVHNNILTSFRNKTERLSQTSEFRSHALLPLGVRHRHSCPKPRQMKNETEEREFSIHSQTGNDQSEDRMAQKLILNIKLNTELKYLSLETQASR